MTLPPNIRVNVGAPFPARVQGSGPIVVTKANGVWTVSFSVTGLAVQTPPPANYPTDYFLMYDSVAKQFFNVPITGGPFGRVRLQRSVVATPVVVAAPDEILNCNINAAAACVLPSYTTRKGLALTFKDVGAQFTAHNLTITPNGTETIEGVNAPIVLNVNRQGLTLVPANDGTNTGWSIE